MRRAAASTTPPRRSPPKPGCLRFDVLADVADPCRFVLYELYRSAADFDAHLISPHFQSFSDATRDLFVTRSIRHLDLQNNG